MLNEKYTRRIIQRRESNLKNDFRIVIYFSFILIPISLTVFVTFYIVDQTNVSSSLLSYENDIPQQQRRQRQRQQQQHQQILPIKDKEVTVEETSLSSGMAKSLLMKPSSSFFDESQIINLLSNNISNKSSSSSSTFITSPTTIVTAYYRTTSKYKPTMYKFWMETMLSLQDPMIIFTSSNMIEQISKLRNHAKDRTVIISLELNELPFSYNYFYNETFWENQLNRDPQKESHKSYKLFWIWLSKPWWIYQAIQLNFFNSDIFLWSDIGCFRSSRYKSNKLIQHNELIPSNEILQMAHHDLNIPSTKLFWNKMKYQDNFYHSGSHMVGYKDTWLIFYNYYLDTIDEFIKRDYLLVDDQVVLQSVCLQYPTICAYVPYNQVDDNNYYGLRYYLYHGGNYTLWRVPSTEL